MNTSTKNKKTTLPQHHINPGSTHAVEYRNLPLTEINFSPFNYRKFFPPQSLEAFAEEIKQHGIISPVIVRPMPQGRFELVAGERRMRAALIAGLTEIPAGIQTLTDEAVIEIQLAENLQREDTHPVHEAQAIGKMQESGKSLEDIAHRLGKSKTFIYSRLKLLALTDPFPEMLLAGKISLAEALHIAALQKEAQQEFFEEYGKDWEKDKDFHLPNLKFCLARYKYDLKEAPFNTKDKKLIPGVGACTSCPFNSGTLKTLFPELAKESVCTNKNCFNEKCTAQFIVDVTAAFEEYHPAALIVDRKPDDSTSKTIQSIPAVSELPQFYQTEINLITTPQPPDKEDYSNEWEIDEGETPELDVEGYNQALLEYETEMEEYQQEIKSDKFSVGLFLKGNKVEPVYFSLEKSSQSYHNGQVTAKEVQAAIKSGKASPALLETEIKRLENKEGRAYLLDKEKIQAIIHEQFTQQLSHRENNPGLTTADLAVARLLIYHHLDYTTRNEIAEQLSLDDKGEENDYHSMNILAQLDDQQFSFLIRKALASKTESKSPFSELGYGLYKVAEATGININAITEVQQQKTDERKKKLLAKTTNLEKLIEKMKTIN